jgi:hypothetical protein
MSKVRGLTFLVVLVALTSIPSATSTHAAIGVGMCPFPHWEVLPEGLTNYNGNGCLAYRDPKLRVIINCHTQGCNIQQVNLFTDWSRDLFAGIGFHWDVSPKGVADGSGAGFAQHNEWHNGPDAWWTSYEGTTVVLTAQDDPQRYSVDQHHVGWRVWTQYRFPYNTGFIKVRHHFWVHNIAQFNAVYPTSGQVLSQMASHVDTPVASGLDTVAWPGWNGASGHIGTGTFAIWGGDWSQPARSGYIGTWNDNVNVRCPGGDLYWGGIIVERKVRDSWCRWNMDPRLSGVWATTIKSIRLVSNKPWMQHRHADGTAIMRIATQEGDAYGIDQRKSLQVVDNWQLSPNLLFSSGISWAWGDDNYYLHAQSVPADPPPIQQGWQMISTEELWFGKGSISAVCQWGRSVHPDLWCP